MDFRENVIARVLGWDASECLNDSLITGENHRPLNRYDTVLEQIRCAMKSDLLSMDLRPVKFILNQQWHKDYFRLKVDITGQYSRDIGNSLVMVVNDERVSTEKNYFPTTRRNFVGEMRSFVLRFCNKELHDEFRAEDGRGWKLFILSSATDSAYRNLGNLLLDNCTSHSPARALGSPHRPRSPISNLANHIHTLPCPPALHLAIPFEVSILDLSANYLTTLKERTDSTSHRHDLRNVLLVCRREDFGRTEMTKDLEDIHLASRIDRLNRALTGWKETMIPLKKRIETQKSLGDSQMFIYLGRIIEYLSVMSTDLPLSHMSDTWRNNVTYTAKLLKQRLQTFSSSHNEDSVAQLPPSLDMVFVLNRLWNDVTAALNRIEHNGVRPALTFSDLSDKEKKQCILRDSLVIFSSSRTGSREVVFTGNEGGNEGELDINDYLREVTDDILDY